jgi:hypothetical protein
MYRYVRHTPLDTGHKYGDILKDGDLKPETIRLFLSTGTLIQVSSPPLSEIPAFEKRAVELAEFNIITVKNLAEADAVILARKIGKSEQQLSDAGKLRRCNGYNQIGQKRNLDEKINLLSSSLEVIKWHKQVTQ